MQTPSYLAPASGSGCVDPVSIHPFEDFQIVGWYILTLCQLEWIGSTPNKDFSLCHYFSTLLAFIRMFNRVKLIVAETQFQHVTFSFLDKLGPTVFAPVKMDFVGNIKVTPYF